jgi:hypothetical protein
MTPVPRTALLRRSRLRDRKRIFTQQEVAQLWDQGIYEPLSFWEWVGEDVNRGIQNLSDKTHIPARRLVAYLSDQVALETANSKGAFSATNPSLTILAVVLVLVLMLLTRLVFQGLPLRLGPLASTAIVATRDLPAYTRLSGPGDYTSRWLLVPLWQMASAPGDVQNRYTLAPLKKGSVIMKMGLSGTIPSGQTWRTVNLPIPPSQANAIPPGAWADLLLTPQTPAAGGAVPGGAAPLVRIQALVLGYQPGSVTVSIEEKSLDSLGQLLGSSIVYLVGR